MMTVSSRSSGEGLISGIQRLERRTAKRSHTSFELGCVTSSVRPYMPYIRAILAMQCRLLLRVGQCAAIQRRKRVECTAVQCSLALSLTSLHIQQQSSLHWNCLPLTEAVILAFLRRFQLVFRVTLLHMPCLISP